MRVLVVGKLETGAGTLPFLRRWTQDFIARFKHHPYACVVFTGCGRMSDDESRVLVRDFVGELATRTHIVLFNETPAQFMWGFGNIHLCDPGQTYTLQCGSLIVRASNTDEIPKRITASITASRDAGVCTLAVSARFRAVDCESPEPISVAYDTVFPSRSTHAAWEFDCHGAFTGRSVWTHIGYTFRELVVDARHWECGVVDTTDAVVLSIGISGCTEQRFRDICASDRGRALLRNGHRIFRDVETPAAALQGCARSASEVIQSVRVQLSGNRGAKEAFEDVVLPSCGAKLGSM